VRKCAAYGMRNLMQHSPLKSYTIYATAALNLSYPGPAHFGALCPISLLYFLRTNTVWNYSSTTIR
jgi:hypothetical protein